MAAKSSGGGQRRAAAAGGIKARGGKRLPGGGRGRAVGGGAAAGATGMPRKGAFGVARGSSRVADKSQGKSTMPVSSASGYGNQVPAKLAATAREPGHTFATSTIPRADGMTQLQKRKQMAATMPSDDDAENLSSLPSRKRQTGASAPETPADAAEGKKPNQLSAGMGFKAAAASAAKSAGVSPQAGAAMVAAASQGASSKAKAKNPNLKKVPTKGSTRQRGGSYS